MAERSRTLAASAGGVLAAFLGSLCCVGPLMFATIGVGAGLASRFEPLRPVFGVLMLATFAVAFQRVYRRPGGAATTSETGPDGSRAMAAYEVSAACAVPVNGRRDRILLWSAAALALALWTFPSWSTLLV